MPVRSASIIICTHNRSALLAETVRDLLSQDYSGGEVEIIVVENGSPDDTRNVIAQLSNGARYPIRYIYEPQPDKVKARNIGAEQAKHPFLVFVDDDCRMGRNWLERLLRGFDLSPSVVPVTFPKAPQV